MSISAPFGGLTDLTGLSTAAIAGITSIPGSPTPASTTYVGPVANNTIIPASLDTSGMCEQSTIHTIRNPLGLSDLQIGLPGFYVTGTFLKETPLPGSYTCDKLSVEYPVGSGTWYDLTKGGSGSWTVPAWDGTTATDGTTYNDLLPLGITIPDGSDIRLYLHATGANLPVFFSNPGRAIYTDEGCNVAASIPSTTPKNVTDSDTFRRRRFAVVHMRGTRSGDSVAIVGDSQQAFISANYDNTCGAPSDHNRGDIPNTIGGTYAYANCAVGGDQWETAMWSFSNRARIARDATIIIDEYGYNSFLNKLNNTETIPLQYKRRGIRFWSGKKVIAANMTQHVTLTNSTAVFTGTSVGTVLTVSAMTSGTIYPGMSTTLSGPGIIIGQVSGTPGGIGVYTLNRSVTFGPGLITATGANIAVDGSDQTVGTFSSAIPTYNSSLTFSGLLPSPLDRYTTTANGTNPQKIIADGINAYYGTRDGTHIGQTVAHGLMKSTNQTAWIAQLAALTTTTITDASADFTGSPTFSGGYLSNGTLTRSDVLPGLGSVTVYLHVKINGNPATAHQIIPNLSTAYCKSLQVNTDGTVTMTTSSGATVVSTATVTDNADHQIAFAYNLTAASAGTAYLAIDGVAQGSAAYTISTATEPTFQIAALTSKNVSINQVAIFNSVDFTSSNFTPVTFNGSEANCVVYWPLATTVTATIGSAMPH